MKVLCILTDNFEDLEAIGTISILRRSGIDVDVYSLTSDKAIGFYKTNLYNLKKLNELNINEYDSLFISGGKQYIALQNDERFINVIKYFYNENKLISAICAGPTILGHLGMLKNRKYTCFSSMNEDFGGTYIDDYCVYDQNIITGKSAAAVIDFAFLIVEKLLGNEACEQVKQSIYYYSKKRV